MSHQVGGAVTVARGPSRLLQLSDSVSELTTMVVHHLHHLRQLGVSVLTSMVALILGVRSQVRREATAPMCNHYDDRWSGQPPFYLGLPRPGFVARGAARGHAPRKGKWTLCIVVVGEGVRV